MAGGRSPGSRWPRGRAGPRGPAGAGNCGVPGGRCPAALSEPATDVLGVDLSEAVDQAVAADGVACNCTRPVDGGAIHVEGDPVAGYLLTIEVRTEAARQHIVPSDVAFVKGERNPP